MVQRSRSKDIRRDKALEFFVSKGIAVRLQKGKCGRRFSDEAVEEILDKEKVYTDLFGCYIYSVRAGKGFTPIYVGSATERRLGVEAFDDAKIKKFLNHMTDYAKGSLYITFIVPRDKVDYSTCTRRGPCPKKTIKCLEKVLIAVAYRKNKNLLNKQNRCLAEFFINGALNSDAGRPTNDVTDFKDMLGLRDKSIVVVKKHE